MKCIVIVLILLATPALAQQQPATALDRVSLALGQCVGNVEQRVDQIAGLQKELAAAQAKIKELETQAEALSKGHDRQSSGAARVK